MGHKAVEKSHSNNAFGPWVANECTVQWWFKKFCKGSESLEDEEHSGQSLPVDNDQLRAIIKADPLPTTWVVAEELSVDHSTTFSIWSKLVEKLDKWVPHELTEKKKKKSSFWSVAFSYSTQKQHTISHLECDLQWKVEFIQLAMTSSVTGSRRSSKALLKAKPVPKKGHGHCFVVCCPSDPLQLSESRWNHIW